MPPNFACKRCSLKAPSRPPSTVTEMNRLSQAPKSIRAPQTTGFTPSPALFGPERPRYSSCSQPEYGFSEIIPRKRHLCNRERIGIPILDTKGMHILNGCGTILVCIYTLAWAWPLGSAEIARARYGRAPSGVFWP